MKKEQDQKSEINDFEETETNDNNKVTAPEKVVGKNKEKDYDEKILELEDKLARSFAEMENQRRRFEKEKDEAFEYGGFSFAKESL